MLRSACCTPESQTPVAADALGMASGWHSVVEVLSQRLELGRGAGNSMQLLQDRASVTASYAECKPGGSHNIHRADPERPSIR